MGVPADAPARLYRILLLFSAVLVLATAWAGPDVPFGSHFAVKQLSLRGEGNAAVWFSSLVLALNAALAWMAAWRFERLGERPLAWCMRGLALFFLSLSADETAQFHEAAGKWVTAHLVQIRGVTDVKDTFGWLVLGLPAGLLFGGCVGWCVRHSAIRYIREGRLALAASACWLGVIGLEYVESQLLASGIHRRWQGAAEEGLELAGALLFLRFLYALGRQLSNGPLSE